MVPISFHMSARGSHVIPRALSRNCPWFDEISRGNELGTLWANISSFEVPLFSQSWLPDPLFPSPPPKCPRNMSRPISMTASMSIDGTSTAYEQAMRVRNDVVAICSPHALRKHTTYTKVQASFRFSYCLASHCVAPCYELRERSRTEAVPTTSTKCGQRLY